MIVATGISSLFHCTGMTLFLGRMPLSYYFFGTVIQFGMTLMVRFAYRFVLLERSKRRKTEEIAKAKRVLLIGGRKGRSDHPAGYQDRKRAEGYCLLYY